MKVLAVGDIVGKPGCIFIKDFLEKIKDKLDIDLCIANGENSAVGNGITCQIAHELYDHGVDVITMGNHVWSKRDVIKLLEDGENIVRPANYPSGTPGTGHIIIDVNKTRVAVVNVSGRVYLDQLDCPFKAVDNELKAINKMTNTNVIIVDFHAEATSEKLAMGWYLDGRISALFGTHTHVQTADERILPGGTGYITDVGMTGPRDSVLGVQKEIIINRFITHMPQKFEVADGPVQFNGVVFDIDETTGKTAAINRIIVK